jgi:GT2 family glycosyltransferase
MSVAVAAIVAHHRQRELLAACLDSLLRALEAVDRPCRAIVVDNASDDGSVELVRERYPEVELLALPRNAGFAGAVNRGLSNSDSEWVLLLNNDTTIEPDAVARLLAAGERRADVGSVAAQMRFLDRPGTINSAGIEIDRLGIVYDRLLGQPAEDGEHEPVEVFGASGGAALLRREMLGRIGGFDDSFFVYLEDADVAWRARMAGWRCLYVPGAVVHHHHSATAGHSSPFKHFHVGLNRVRLLAKNADTRHLLRYGAAIAAYELAYVAFACVADRTLAPVRGRRLGLRQWASYRRAGCERRPIELAPVRGVRAALGRRAAWTGR